MKIKFGILFLLLFSLFSCRDNNIEIGKTEMQEAETELYKYLKITSKIPFREIKRVHLTPDGIKDFYIFEEDSEEKTSISLFDGKTQKELIFSNYCNTEGSNFRIITLNPKENFKAILFTTTGHTQSTLNIIKYNPQKKMMEKIFEYTIQHWDGSKIFETNYIDILNDKTEYISTITIYEGIEKGEDFSIYKKNNMVLKKFTYNPLKQIFE